jgi:hypothetical protein
VAERVGGEESNRGVWARGFRRAPRIPRARAGVMGRDLGRAPDLLHVPDRVRPHGQRIRIAR